VLEFTFTSMLQSYPVLDGHVNWLGFRYMDVN